MGNLLVIGGILGTVYTVFNLGTRAYEFFFKTDFTRDTYEL